LIETYRRRLMSLYEGNLPPPAKRQAKTAMLNHLKEDYEALRKSWDGYTGYDSWFRQNVNNAKIATVAAYNDLVPAFLSVLEGCNNDLECFYERCRDLAKRPRHRRHEELRQSASRR